MDAGQQRPVHLAAATEQVLSPQHGGGQHKKEGDAILGICALHICWDDLAEIRSLAVDESRQKAGIGRLLVNSCLDEAASLEINQVFVLTYQAAFFRKFGFMDTDKQNLPHKIWSDCLHCAKFPDCDEDALIRRAGEVR